MLGVLELIIPVFCVQGILNSGRIMSKKNVCILSGVILFSLIALRSTTTGGDTEIYMNAFYRVEGMSFSDTILYGFMDKGYSALEWVVHKLRGEFRWILLLNGACFSFAISRYIFKHSDRAALSFLLLFSFNLAQFSVSGIRQTFAMSFVLFALMKYWDKKYVPALILYVLAVAMHLSSVVVIVILPLAWLFKNENMPKYSLLILGIVFVFKYQVASKMAVFFNSYSDRIGEIELGSQSGMIMCIVVLSIYTVGVLFRKQYYQRYENARYDFSMLFMASFFEILVTTQAIFFRLAFYTLFSIVVVCPRVIEVSVTNRSKNLLSGMAYILALVMIYGFTIHSIAGGYHFLWQ